MKMKSKTPARREVTDPRKLKRLPRGSFLAKAGETQASNTKVRISIMVDLDVLKFFKEQAAAPGALPYQTQMNKVLRSEMGRKETLHDALVRDERFVDAVAHRLKTLSGTKGKDRNAA
jgi:uncharacterized protein (DUF4415 family)